MAFKKIFEAIVMGRLRAGKEGKERRLKYKNRSGSVWDTCSPLVASTGSKQSSEAHVLHEEENWVTTVTVASK